MSIFLNVFLSTAVLITSFHIAFLFREPVPDFSPSGGMWVTRDAKGQILSMSPDRPVFRNPLDFSAPIKGIATYGYEWKYKEHQ